MSKDDRVEVTQADRDAAKSILWVKTIIDDIESIEQAFARHRIAVVEECARVAEQKTCRCAQDRTDRADDELAFQFHGLGRVIAAAIRTLKGA
jgi:hypothetical protein